MDLHQERVNCTVLYFSEEPLYVKSEKKQIRKRMKYDVYLYCHAYWKL